MKCEEVWIQPEERKKKEVETRWENHLTINVIEQMIY